MDRIQACLASNIRRYRKQMGYSQEKLAEKAGASANYIAMIEAGRYFPSLPMLNKVASALNIDSLDLFDKSGFEFQSLETLKNEILKNISQTVNNSFIKAAKNRENMAQKHIQE